MTSMICQGLEGIGDGRGCGHIADSLDFATGEVGILTCPGCGKSLGIEAVPLKSEQERDRLEYIHFLM
jgi:hypothetical protein